MAPVVEANMTFQAHQLIKEVISDDEASVSWSMPNCKELTIIPADPATPIVMKTINILEVAAFFTA